MGCLWKPGKIPLFERLTELLQSQNEKKKKKLIKVQHFRHWFVTKPSLDLVECVHCYPKGPPGEYFYSSIKKWPLQNGAMSCNAGLKSATMVQQPPSGALDHCNFHFPFVCMRILSRNVHKDVHRHSSRMATNKNRRHNQTAPETKTEVLGTQFWQMNGHELVALTTASAANTIALKTRATLWPLLAEELSWGSLIFYITPAVFLTPLLRGEKRNEDFLFLAPARTFSKIHIQKKKKEKPEPQCSKNIC